MLLCTHQQQLCTVLLTLVVLCAAAAQTQPYLYEPNRGSQAQPSTSSQSGPQGRSVYDRCSHLPSVRQEGSILFVFRHHGLHN